MAGMSASATPMFAGGQKRRAFAAKNTKAQRSGWAFLNLNSRYIIAHLRGNERGFRTLYRFLIHRLASDCCVSLY